MNANLHRFVRLQKGPFIGREALLEEVEKADGRRLVGLMVTDRGIPRAGQRVLRDGIEVGEVTSGSLSPTLNRGIAMALVERAFTEEGTALQVDIRGRTVDAIVTALPFYKREKKGEARS